MGTRKIKRRHRKVKGGGEGEGGEPTQIPVAQEVKPPQAPTQQDAQPLESGGPGLEILPKTDEARETKESEKELLEKTEKEGAVPGAEAVPGAVPGAEVVPGAEAVPGEPTEEQIENKEKVELKESLDDALKGIPFVGQIIDSNPIAGHAITLFTSVFPQYSERLTTFLSDEKNKAAINGILSEMSKTEFADDPTKQAEIFSSEFGKQLKLNETEVAQFTPDAIMKNVNTMKDKIKTTLTKNSASSTNVVKSDLPDGAKIKGTTVVFKINTEPGTGGKRKSKTNKTKTKKAKKTKKTKSKRNTKAKRRTHKKKSKK